MAEHSGPVVRGGSASEPVDPGLGVVGQRAEDQKAGFDAVILAGGAASRLGGADKPSVEIGGQTMLDAALTACAAAQRTVVVGPRRAVGRDVIWTREEPAGAGPAAALAAGLTAHEVTHEATDADRNADTDADSPYLIVLAADLPFIDAEVIHSLWTTLTRSAEPDSTDRPDGAVAIDETGRAQWLTACYRRSALLDRIHSFEPDQLVGLSLRRLLAGLRLAEVRVPDRAAFDCDTWAQIDQARSLTSPTGPTGPSNPASPSSPTNPSNPASPSNLSGGRAQPE